MVPVSPVDTYTALFELDPDEARGIVPDVLPKPVSRVPVSPAMMPKATLPATTADDELASVLESDEACQALYHAMSLTRTEYGTNTRINKILVSEGAAAVVPKVLSNIITAGRRIINKLPPQTHGVRYADVTAREILSKCGGIDQLRPSPGTFLEALKASVAAQNAIREGISEKIAVLTSRVSAILASEDTLVNECSVRRLIIVARAYSKNPITARKVYPKYIGYLSFAKQLFSSKDQGLSAPKKARLS